MFAKAHTPSILSYFALRPSITLTRPTFAAHPQAIMSSPPVQLQLRERLSLVIAFARTRQSSMFLSTQCEN